MEIDRNEQTYLESYCANGLDSPPFDQRFEIF